MKVNISGVGLIPKVGLLAPVYGKDLTKDTIQVILNYASFKVYVAATGVRITKKNINEIFGEAVRQAVVPTAPAPVAVPKKKAPKKAPKVEKPVVEETPVEIEQVEEPVVLNEVVEAPAIEEPVEAVEITADTTDADIESSFVEDVEAVEEQLDEAPVEEEKPAYTSKKKKRR